MNAPSVIYKYDLSLDSPRTYALARGAKIVHVGRQGEDYRVWVLQSSDNNVETVERTFVIIETGWTFLSDKLEHVGSMIDGDFVWHVFATKEEMK